MVASDLPQEIWIDIFSRLPAKSVGQYRCLSKPWRDILSSPHFIKSHLNRKPHQESLLLIDRSHSIRSIDSIKDGAVSREFEFPFDCSGTVGSCDGLVLLVNDEDDKFLVNPVTLNKVIIPNSPLALKDEKRLIYTMHGFGYDSSIDDYKIVTLSCYKDEDVAGFDCDEMFVDVYLVKTGVWKRVESRPYSHTVIPGPHSGAFLNRAIHWLGRSRDHGCVLVAFDLFDEVFTEISVPPPVDIQTMDFWCCQIVVLGGCLCIVDAKYGFRTNVWIMKEYGLVESWTKHSIGPCGKWAIGKPLCFVWDEAMLSVADGRPLGIYNLKDRTLRKMIVDGVSAYCETGVSFVPSLVSPAANVEKACLSSDALMEASAAKLGRALSHDCVLVQCLKDYMTIVSALERSSLENKSELISKLKKRSGELSMSTTKYRKLQNCIWWLSNKLVYEWHTVNQSVEAYEGPKEFRVDLYEHVVRMCCRQLGESGQVDDVATPAEVAIGKGNIGC